MNVILPTAVEEGILSSGALNLETALLVGLDGPLIGGEDGKPDPVHVPLVEHVA